VTEWKVDIDGALPAGIVERVTWLAWILQLRIGEMYIRRTRHGWHLLVRVSGTMHPAAIVAAQTILGSDPHREAFNLMRVRNLRRVPTEWRTRWNVLYHSHYRGVRCGESIGRDSRARRASASRR
jgi:hypothetical protein